MHISASWCDCIFLHRGIFHRTIFASPVPGHSGSFAASPTTIWTGSCKLSIARKLPLRPDARRRPACCKPLPASRAGLRRGAAPAAAASGGPRPLRPPPAAGRQLLSGRRTAAVGPHRRTRRSAASGANRRTRQSLPQRRRRNRRRRSRRERRLVVSGLRMPPSAWNEKKTWTISVWELLWRLQSFYNIIINSVI